jgi:RES domain-containing protein
VGIALVYLGGSAALCALETFVHLIGADRNMNFVLFRVDIPDEAMIETLQRHQLPPNWRDEPAPASTMAIGTQWSRQKRTALLRVPSVVVPEESNYLLDPAHPEATRILVSPPQQFSFDPRMWKA